MLYLRSQRYGQQRYFTIGIISNSMGLKLFLKFKQIQNVLDVRLSNSSTTSGKSSFNDINATCLIYSVYFIIAIYIYIANLGYQDYIPYFDYIVIPSIHFLAMDINNRK